MSLSYLTNACTPIRVAPLPSQDTSTQRLPTKQSIVHTKSATLGSSRYARKEDNSLAVREGTQKLTRLNCPSRYARDWPYSSCGFSLHLRCIEIAKPSGELSVEFFSIIGETESSSLFFVLSSSVSPLFSIQFMQHTRSQGSPDFEAYSEQERELRERIRKFRSRLSKLVEKKVRILIPIADMGDANPPARRTIHQRACDSFTGARSSITRPAQSNTNTWQIPSHVMNTISNSTQFHGLEDEDAP
ncbi:hypothetical protein L1987_59946 [Smallanthus sonchifolius]|uniref:Uncharacterized protein n=1 Tax=Smallanthus sonchifolius TaxID=185202 RepID=A0ACB9D716_9ASTR|nr:hypothetical protein L1987_59946 [Smallanthus sonchifolius]